MFYGFNLGKLNKQAKPKKLFSKRTGLFNRQLKDELLKEDYNDNYKTDDKVTPSKSVFENKGKLYHRGIWDRIVEIIIAILILLLIFSFLSRMEFLSILF